MAINLPYVTMEDADQRSREWWVAILGHAKNPEDVTEFVYRRAEVDGIGPAVVINQRDGWLDSLIAADEMEPQEAGECSDLYPAWAMGTTYAIDDLVGYDDALWKCRQAHTATDGDWIPPSVPALWLRYRKNADTLLDWVIGERVLLGWQRTYGGGTYEVIQEHVTQSDWTPDATPTLWSVVAPPTPDWAAGVAYAVDDHVMYLGNEYRCLQAHTSIQTWNPVATLNVLWALV